LLIEKGWRLDNDLQYCEDQNAGHDEAAWGARIDPALRFFVSAAVAATFTAVAARSAPPFGANLDGKQRRDGFNT